MAIADTCRNRGKVVCAAGSGRYIDIYRGRSRVFQGMAAVETKVQPPVVIKLHGLVQAEIGKRTRPQFGVTLLHRGGEFAAIPGRGLDTGTRAFRVFGTAAGEFLFGKQRYFLIYREIGAQHRARRKITAVVITAQRLFVIETQIYTIIKEAALHTCKQLPGVVISAVIKRVGSQENTEMCTITLVPELQPRLRHIPFGAGSQGFLPVSQSVQANAFIVAILQLNAPFAGTVLSPKPSSCRRR